MSHIILNISISTNLLIHSMNKEDVQKGTVNEENKTKTEKRECTRDLSGKGWRNWSISTCHTVDSRGILDNSLPRRRNRSAAASLRCAFSMTGCLCCQWHRRRGRPPGALDYHAAGPRPGEASGPVRKPLNSNLNSKSLSSAKPDMCCNTPSDAVLVLYWFRLSGPRTT